MKNKFAVQMMATKAAISQAEREHITHHTIDVYCQASAVALNEEFGFGKDRVERYREKLEAVIMEYGGLMGGADVEYADGKLKARFDQIMEEKKHGEVTD